MGKPLGPEFMSVFQRMNLGQPLPEALSYSVEKFQSYELDLIKRAVAIQSEVGGSLAELLDKTNQSLRQRLKLVRQVRVLTTQSRLTAVIVGILPVVLALALETISPGYLSPLTESDIGRVLIGLAVLLEILGLLVMRRMASIKV
jgi:tight adherence protein B